MKFVVENFARLCPLRRNSVLASQSGAYTPLVTYMFMCNSVLPS